MFTAEDVKAITDVARNREARRIFIVGSIESGKTFLASQLSRALDLPHIALDEWDEIYSAENGRKSDSIDRTLRFALERVGARNIVEHAELLTSSLSLGADLIVCLKPDS